MPIGKKIFEIMINGLHTGKVLVKEKDECDQLKFKLVKYARNRVLNIKYNNFKHDKTLASSLFFKSIQDFLLGIFELVFGP